MTATPWSRFTMPLAYAPSVTGAPLPNAKLYFYVGSSTSEGTSTPLDTFADAALSIPNTNPVVADAGGVFPPIFLLSTEYMVMLTDQYDTEIWTQNPVSPFILAEAEQATTVILELTVDGNGGVPAVGICGDLYVPFDCTITQAVIQSTQAGSIVIDVWAAPFVVNTPPSPTDSIVAGAPPTLSNAQSSIDTTLTGWATDIPAGTAMRFNIDSIDSVTRFTLSLVATRNFAS
jgi:hypothetical protein